MTTEDGLRLDAALLRGTGPATSAVVVANGFTGSWRHPATRRIAERLRAAGDVMLFDFRGHHASEGECTVGDRELLDLEAVVAHLRGLGYRSITTVGFSMGASVVVRHAALYGGVAATVAVSGPSHWYYRGTLRMWLLHVALERRAGRMLLKLARGVRVTNRRWDPVPPDPTQLAADVAPAPLLVVHGDADTFFPVEHARRVHEAARAPKELWIEPGMGHAERGMSRALADRIANWITARTPTGTDEGIP